MTDNDNVKKINNENTQSSTPAPKADAVQETEPDLNPKSSEDVIKLSKWLDNLAVNSTIPNQLNCYKTVLFNEGTPNMWGLRLKFPGVFEATNIETSAMHDSTLDIKKLFQNCIKAGVIIAPKIVDVEAFANTHKSFGEAATQILNFLNDGTNGKLR